jgi:hypothetical protein
MLVIIYHSEPNDNIVKNVNSKFEVSMYKPEFTY